MFVLEDLWHGDLDVSSFCVPGSQYPEALNYSDFKEEELKKRLSKELAVLFSEYTDMQQELRKISDCESFVMGFRLGALLIMDILCPGKMKEL